MPLANTANLQPNDSIHVLGTITGNPPSHEHLMIQVRAAIALEKEGYPVEKIWLSLAHPNYLSNHKSKRYPKHPVLGKRPLLSADQRLYIVKALKEKLLEIYANDANVVRFLEKLVFDETEARNLPKEIQENERPVPFDENRDYIEHWEVWGLIAKREKMPIVYVGGQDLHRNCCSLFSEICHGMPYFIAPREENGPDAISSTLIMEGDPATVALIENACPGYYDTLVKALKTDDDVDPSVLRFYEKRSNWAHHKYSPAHIKINLRHNQYARQKESAQNKDITIYAHPWVESQLAQLSVYFQGKTWAIFDADERIVETITLGEDETLSLRHLQMLARNEPTNVTGSIDFSLYPDIPKEVVLSLKDLVRTCILTGQIKVTSYGGFRCDRVLLDEPQEMTLCDLSGFQYQTEDNTGSRLLFIPQDPKPFPEGALDKSIYTAITGREKPTFVQCQDEQFYPVVNYRNKDMYGRFDLPAASLAIAQDFYLFIYAASLNVSKEQDLSFSFVRYGAGFFAGYIDQTVIERAIIQGIYLGLSQVMASLNLRGYPERRIRVELPFYNKNGPFVSELEALCETHRIELSFPAEDVLKPAPENFLKAVTNGADPHAPTGNEGGKTPISRCPLYISPSLELIDKNIKNAVWVFKHNADYIVAHYSNGRLVRYGNKIDKKTLKMLKNLLEAELTSLLEITDRNLRTEILGQDKSFSVDAAIADNNTEGHCNAFNSAFNSLISHQYAPLHDLPAQLIALAEQKGLFPAIKEDNNIIFIEDKNEEQQPNIINIEGNGVNDEHLAVPMSEEEKKEIIEEVKPCIVSYTFVRKRMLHKDDLITIHLALNSQITPLIPITEEILKNNDHSFVKAKIIESIAATTLLLLLDADVNLAPVFAVTAAEATQKNYFPSIKFSEKGAMTLDFGKSQAIFAKGLAQTLRANGLKSIVFNLPMKSSPSCSIQIKDPKEVLHYVLQICGFKHVHNNRELLRDFYLNAGEIVLTAEQLTKVCEDIGEIYSEGWTLDWDNDQTLFFASLASALAALEAKKKVTIGSREYDASLDNEYSLLFQFVSGLKIKLEELTNHLYSSPDEDTRTNAASRLNELGKQLYNKHWSWKVTIPQFKTSLSELGVGIIEQLSEKDADIEEKLTEEQINEVALIPANEEDSVAFYKTANGEVMLEFATQQKRNDFYQQFQEVELTQMDKNRDIQEYPELYRSNPSGKTPICYAQHPTRLFFPSYTGAEGGELAIRCGNLANRNKLVNLLAGSTKFNEVNYKNRDKGLYYLANTFAVYNNTDLKRTKPSVYFLRVELKHPGMFLKFDLQKFTPPNTYQLHAHTVFDKVIEQGKKTDHILIEENNNRKCIM